MSFCAESPLKIGTRGSLLAVAQARETQGLLAQALGLPAEAFRIEILQTTGDRVQDRPLGAIGGKGLFTKEIEVALAEGRIDIAVHSMKDVPTERPDGFVLDCFLPREDPRDAFLSKISPRLEDLPSGAVVGTSSLRRRAQVLLVRPDIKVVEFRGNVQTRLRKLDEGQADATFLAVAGLRRLGQADLVTSAVSDQVMLPAVAQGAIGIECRAEDSELRAGLAQINDPPTAIQMAAERAFLAGLDGSCQTPIAALSEVADDQMTLRGQVVRLDGSEALSDHIIGPADQAAALGQALADRILGRMPDGFL